MRSSRTFTRSSRAATLAAVALFVAACSGSDTVNDSAPVTEAPASVETELPVATESPAATEPPATEAPVTDPPVIEPPAETDPPVTEPENTADIELGNGFGPYEVGVQTILVPDLSGGGRDLTVDVWFPLSQDIDANLPPQQYTLLPGTYYESPSAAAATAESIATDGPFPLVIYSHGSRGIRFLDSNYTEALASNGYIVAAPDHIGNTAVDQIAGSETSGTLTLFNRPNDVTRVIDAFLDPENIEMVGFVANLNPSQIAVTGHSLGGFTAYAMASGYDNENGEFVADERVGAIIPLAPAASGTLLNDERLASIGIPTLVLGATDDETTPIDPNVTRPWELTSSDLSYRLDLTAAEHGTFTDACTYLAFLPTLEAPAQIVIDLLEARTDAGCDADDMPIERAQSITNTFAVSFLDSVFKGGTPIALDEVDEQTDFVYLIK
jgi:predicted dienelactone hydrolase